MIFLEIDIEKAKQKLALKLDFNLFDAFRMFDKYSLGDITKLDFEEGLKKVGLYAISKKEIDLFFKRYDIDGDYKLKQNEFALAFKP
jgi:Ca2+-binding EF-hand superfamily protein